MRQLCNVDLNSMPVLDRLALLANAYNVLMTAMIVHYNPGKSVKEISDVVDSNVWDEPFWTLGGNKVSLTIIEHELIRGRDVYPVENRLAVQGGVSGRIHTSIVCGSLSCPSLLDVPFDGSNLVDLITENTRRWLLNPTKNAGPVEGRAAVKLSSIFNWFYEDFVIESGSAESFVRQFAGWTTAQVPDGAEIEYDLYRWELNALNASGKPLPSAGASAFRSSMVISTVPLLLLAMTAGPKSC